MAQSPSLTALRLRIAMRGRMRGRWMVLRSVPLRVGALSSLLVVAGLGYWWSSSEARDVAGPTTPASGSRLPVLPMIVPPFDGVPLEEYLQPPAIAEHQRDELLASPVLRDPEFARAVHGWVRYWRVSAVDWFPGFLDRMAWLGTSVDSAVATHGFPPSLRYLPLIESGYDPRVTSRASAVGLWQLMPLTARVLGLEVAPLLDERRHPLKSTEAALTYLDDLHREFDSWFLTLAAYNSGPTRVRQILRRHAPGEPRTDSLFWALREHFPRETREFVPKLYGAMWVASRPEAYGYDASVVTPLEFDLVSVPDLTSLEVVAIASGASYEEVVRLNPEYVRELTPPDRAMTVRIPVGRRSTFERIYPRLIPQERVTSVKHVVRFDETISSIAARYGVGTEEIDAANPHVRPRGLRVGERLVVPVMRSADEGS